MLVLRGIGAFALGVWVIALGCGSDHISDGQPGDPTLRLRQVAAGLDFPLFLTSPPGDTARLFIVEKTGGIRLVEHGTLVPAPFLDIRAKVSNGGEQGLLGLAFHPQYANNGLFVVDYTNTQGDTRVSQFHVSSNPNLADPTSEQVILAVDQPFANHNGGMVVFGPDGDLYIGLGDGGSAGDPQGNGQNRGALLGKILRFAVSGTGQVSVPSDNPFVGVAGARGEIWSYGLRNPWRFTFDRSTGDLYVGDVGQNEREEVDVVTTATQFGRGRNFGWNIMEGTRCFSPAQGCNQSGLTLPLVDYDHGSGCSVTGGYVYRGPAIASLRGTYFYSDYCAGWVRSFRFQEGRSTEAREWPDLAPGGSVTSFGEDAAGELYIMISSGMVFRIEQAR